MCLGSDVMSLVVALYAIKVCTSGTLLPTQYPVADRDFLVSSQIKPTSTLVTPMVGIVLKSLPLSSTAFSFSRFVSPYSSKPLNGSSVLPACQRYNRSFNMRTI